MSCTGSSVDYGRKLVNGGLSGARNGSGEFLQGKRIATVMTASARSAICPAVVGTCIGILSSILQGPKKSTGRAMLFGVAGCAAGFAAGLAWKNRQLASSAAQGAAHNINRVRRERWMEQNSIAYA
jgi:hypothetical protein